MPTFYVRACVSHLQLVRLRGFSHSAIAAEGAVLFLEKVAPALEHVDSSSGAIGSAVNRNDWHTVGGR